ncbi:hypothetical protein WICMUC_003529 [Wickerhamomyces mucosus]|uniref:Uncharacterized protein n=1 Tax=Wickerhamomyces mucosus TaxID=1378264 RepID=A0A9P8TCV1_9ASCO|nr:hypothetical protein WICMUC_003529 [Wickerhamomyces mucosus]
MTDFYHSPRQTENDLQFNSDSDSLTSSTPGKAFLKSPIPSIKSSNSIDQDSQFLTNLVSRPLSRSSITSGISTTATKDGVEGKRIKKHGIPGYPLNLINKMYNTSSQVKSSHYLQPEINYSEDEINDDDDDDDDDKASVYSVKSLSSMIPQYSKEEFDERRSVLSNDVNEDTIEKDED